MKKLTLTLIGLLIASSAWAVTQNSSNQKYANNADGWELSGGTTARKVTVTGGDVTLTSSASPSTYTMPGANTTLVGHDTTQTLTNKTISAADNVITADDVTCTNCLTVTEVASADAATNVSDADFGDVTVASGAWAVEDSSHAHSAATITEADPLALLTAGTDNVKDTHIDWGTGAGQVNPADFADQDIGDITLTTGSWAVEDDSHAHTSSSVSGIDISADTNLTAGDNLTLTDDDLDLDAALTAITSIAIGANTVDTNEWANLDGLNQTVATTSTPRFARVGLGQAADAGAVMQATGQYNSVEATCTLTLDWNNGNVQYIQLTNGANGAFTFSNPEAGGRYVLIIKQPSSGAAGTVTWPATVSWPGSTTPTLSTTNDKVDVVSFVYDTNNTKYYGSTVQNF